MNIGESGQARNVCAEREYLNRESWRHLCFLGEAPIERQGIRDIELYAQNSKF